MGSEEDPGSRGAVVLTEGASWQEPIAEAGTNAQTIHLYLGLREEGLEPRAALPGSP